MYILVYCLCLFITFLCTRCSGVRGHRKTDSRWSKYCTGVIFVESLLQRLATDHLRFVSSVHHHGRHALSSRSMVTSNNQKNVLITRHLI